MLNCTTKQKFELERHDVVVERPKNSNIKQELQGKTIYLVNRQNHYFIYLSLTKETYSLHF